MPLRFQCSCGVVYREDSAHGTTCKMSRHPEGDKVATPSQVKEYLRKESFFQTTRELRKENSTCPKSQTASIIVKNNNIVARGFNMCSPAGEHYGSKFIECKRLNTPALTNYELCRPLHSEFVCLLDYIGVDFTKFTGLWNAQKVIWRLSTTKDLQGAELFLSGHYQPCDECAATLRMVGINDVHLDWKYITEISERYKKSNIYKETNWDK